MTNNLTANFACSVYEVGETLPAGKSVGDFKDYPIVVGSVVNDEYSETLDSATIRLSQVALKDRLTTIQPYQCVRVFDKSGNTNIDQVMLVDSYEEKENNITKGSRFFGYTINLMSQTKWLEKFQCPNLVITHTVNSDGTTTAKTIFDKIYEYAQLFIPKMKMAYDDNGTTKWHYEPLIRVPGSPNANLGVLPRDIVNGTLIITQEGNLKFVYEALNCFSFTLTESVQGDGWTNIYLTNNLPFAVTFPDGFKIGEYREDGEDSDISFYNGDRTIQPYETIFVDNVSDSATSISLYFETEKEIVPSIDLTEEQEENDFVNRFNVRCADMAFTAPTLRQLFTALMQQVGCIPTVKNRTLGFLDFQKPGVPFAQTGNDYYLDNTVNYVSRSLSSDSYVNTLVNISEQVLDSGNEVISETLCFRDSGNVLLQQEKNLYLETSFPIYKVNKCIMHGPGKFDGFVSSGYGCFTPLSQTPWEYSDVDMPQCYYGCSYIALENNIKEITWTISIATDSPSVGFTVRNCKLLFLGKRYSGGFYTIGEQTISDFTITPSNSTRENIRLADNDADYRFDVLNYKKTFTSGNSSIVGFTISGTFVNNTNGKTQDFTFYKFTTQDEDQSQQSSIDCFAPFDNSVAGHLPMGAAVVRYKLNNLVLDRELDISKLIVESQQRELLSRDYLMMSIELNISNQNTSITTDKLSKYVYGTVGYTIGSTKISGFSEVYSKGYGTVFGWIQENFTYIENITSALCYDNTQVEKAIQKNFPNLPIVEIRGAYASGSRGLGQGTYRVNDFKFYNPNEALNNPLNPYSNKPFFSTFWFDIYYQPLNSFNMSYVKSLEDVDIPLEQYDSNASGVSDFDRLSLNEQEQVDRIGNETLTISQRATDYLQVRDFSQGPLIYKDDTDRDGDMDENDNGIDYVIFKRSFAIKNNCFNVSYVGSKDAILKDYFTSIRTKYRAYQYINVGQSTTRKEKDVIYVRISTDRYDGDNKVWLGAYSYFNEGNMQNFIYDINNQSSDAKISYECEKDIGKVWSSGSYLTETQTIKNSVSIITTSNTMGFIYQYMDYIGVGPYINQITQVVQFSKDEKLGGIPQQWHIWADGYNEKHTVSFVSSIDFYNNNVAEGVSSRVKKIQKSPIVDSSYLDLEGSEHNIFSICDDNSVTPTNYKAIKRTFYKDPFELINHTVQFIYYAPNKDVLFGEDFIAGAPLVGRFDHPFNALIGTNDFSLKTTEYNYSTNDSLYYGSSINDYISRGMNSITITWPTGKTVVKLCYRTYRSGNSKLIDIAVFKRPSNNEATTTFYFSFNDTKTDYVLEDKDGILYRRYKVSTYTTEENCPRTVVDLYPNDEEE